MIQAKLHSAVGQSEITSETWQNVILEKEYKALIFDCDGTLVESADVHFASFHKAAADQGCELDQDWYLARTGLDRRSLFQEFAQAHKGRFEIEAAISLSISVFIDISDRVLPIPDTEKLVSYFAGRYPLAVGTNAERQVAEASLRATGMRDYFDHIVAVTDGLKPKPSPEIFARAADLLRSPRVQTLVIEDSSQGVAAAIAAGMDVIEITSIT